MTKRLRKIEFPEKRFWRRVKKTKNCWLWLGCKRNKHGGYGIIQINGKPISTHRFSYEININKIQKGLYVCHKCDNPSCVNPKHLFLGTPQDNVRDRDIKERLAKGEKQGLSKLKNEDIKKIRESYKSGFYSIRKIASLL